ncbi:HNH endonuclease [Elizabethkingia anophelis]|nr:HNH endonuclease [Elizabethkingia anophelis]
MSIIGELKGPDGRKVLISNLLDLEKILDNPDVVKYAIDNSNKYTLQDLREKIALDNGWDSSIKNIDAWYEEQSIKDKILKKHKEKDLYKKIKQQMIDEGAIKIINKKRREPIPQDTQDAVWNRDGGKCVKCGSGEKLEFDHIIPFSKGGSNTYRNLQLLCENCNRTKSNKIG